MPSPEAPVTLDTIKAAVQAVVGESVVVGPSTKPGIVVKGPEADVKLARAVIALLNYRLTATMTRPGRPGDLFDFYVAN